MAGPAAAATSFRWACDAANFSTALRWPSVMTIPHVCAPSGQALSGRLPRDDPSEPCRRRQLRRRSGNALVGTGENRAASLPRPGQWEIPRSGATSEGAGSAVSTPSRAEGPARRDAGPALRAEEVGFEPTVPCRTTVFETVRFGRSRTPPPAKVVDACCSDSRSWQVADAATAKRRKEGAELPRCLLFQHTTGHGDL